MIDGYAVATKYPSPYHPINTNYHTWHIFCLLLSTGWSYLPLRRIKEATRKEAD